MSGKLSPSLQLKVGQNLVMTPQLQQAIKLLQLSNLELDQFLEQEMAQNPLLEKIDAKETKPDSLDSAHDGNTSGDLQNDFDGAWSNQDDAKNRESDTGFDPGSSPYAGLSASRSSFEPDDRQFGDGLTRPENLRDHLLQQLHVECEDTKDRLIGALLIDQIDEAGYLRYDTDDLARRLDCPVDRMQRLMDVMRRFDPPGIFARDLKDCLRLQLADRGALDAPMDCLLDNLHLVAAHDIKQLAQKCGANETYIRDMIAELRTLSPKPAAQFEHVLVQTVIPDIFMRRLPKDVGGGWRVELNNDTLPRVLVNQSYYTTISAQAKSDKDKNYISTQLSSANWLIKALDQRAQTILKVASAIVEAQDTFFLYGIEYLKPLTLKTVADMIDMHESTVSRVTTNKYIGTPRGVFELKYFFSSTIGGDHGVDHAGEAVKARIKSIIDAEDAKTTFSDDDIVERLKKDGVTIARRTVAKYRDQMGIPSSVQRRRKKKSARE